MSRIMRLYAIVIVVVLSLSTSIGQGRRGYEVEAQVYSVPGYPSDAARAIAAYERLMERHMDLTERTLAGLTADVKALTARLDAVDTLAAKLDALDAKVTQLDSRLARIEKHLGIVPPPPVPLLLDPNAPPAPMPPAGNPLPIPQRAI